MTMICTQLRILCLAVLCVVASIFPAARASVLADTWVHTTVLVTNPKGETGSGFLMQRSLAGDASEGKIFLVTNKHVIGKTEQLRNMANTLVLVFNAKEKTGAVKARLLIVPLRNRQLLWKGHLDPNVDVAAIDVTAVLKYHPEIQFKVASYDTLATEQTFKDYDVTAGQDILLIGYPLGCRSARTIFPLIRQGIIASDPQEPITIAEKPGVELPAFYIESFAVPGNSGGPVILRPGLFHLDPKANSIVTGSIPPLLVGIQSMAPTGLEQAKTIAGDKITDLPFVYSPYFAGLAVVFRADTIRQTIEQFFNVFAAASKLDIPDQPQMKMKIHHDSH